jgi:hypothetical protein
VSREVASTNLRTISQNIDNVVPYPLLLYSLDVVLGRFCVLSPNAVLEELLAMSTIMLWPRGILLVGIREGQYSHSRVENTFHGGGQRRVGE